MSTNFIFVENTAILGAARQQRHTDSVVLHHHRSHQLQYQCVHILYSTV